MPAAAAGSGPPPSPAPPRTQFGSEIRLSHLDPKQLTERLGALQREGGQLAALAAEVHERKVRVQARLAELHSEAAESTAWLAARVGVQAPQAEPAEAAAAATPEEAAPPAPEPEPEPEEEAQPEDGDDGFFPVTEDEFLALPPLVRGRTKLQEINEVRIRRCRAAVRQD